MSQVNTNKKILREVFVVWGILILVFKLLFLFQGISWVDENTSLIMAVGLLYAPLALSFKKHEKINFIDHSISDVGKSMVVFFALSIVLFPFIFAGNHFYQLLLGNSFHGEAYSGWGKIILAQLSLVALPEEFFFRGYMQNQLNFCFEKRWKWLGVKVGPALLVTSFVFALSHSILTFQWWHIFIFFPALAFGWLFEKRGTITAPVLFHLVCNLFSQWVGGHYF